MSTRTHEHFSEVTGPDPVVGRLAGTALALDGLVDRLRSVRLKVGRWLPNSDALAAWSVAYAEVYKAARRLDSAVQTLDAHLAEVGPEAGDEQDALTLQMLLCDVEIAAEAFEESVIENLAGA